MTYKKRTPACTGVHTVGKGVRIGNSAPYSQPYYTTSETKMQEKNEKLLTVLYKEPFRAPVVLETTYDRMIRLLKEDGGEIKTTSFASDVNIIHADNGTYNFVCGFDWIHGRAAFVGVGREGAASLTPARINRIRYLYKWGVLNK